MNNPMILASVKEDFYLNFIKDDRYLWLLDGLKTTLIITVFAVIVGSDHRFSCGNHPFCAR